MLYKAKKLLADQVIDTAGRKNPINKWALSIWTEGNEDNDDED